MRTRSTPRIFASCPRQRRVPRGCKRSLASCRARGSRAGLRRSLGPRARTSTMTTRSPLLRDDVDLERAETDVLPRGSRSPARRRGSRRPRPRRRARAVAPSAHVEFRTPCALRSPRTSRSCGRSAPLTSRPCCTRVPCLDAVRAGEAFVALADRVTSVRAREAVGALAEVWSLVVGLAVDVRRSGTSSRRPCRRRDRAHCGGTTLLLPRVAKSLVIFVGP